MAKFSGLLIVTLFLTSLFSLSFGQENKLLSKVEVFDIYENKNKELNLPLVDLKNITFSRFETQKTNMYPGKKVLNVGCFGGGLEMDIDIETGKILKCLNRIGYEKTWKSIHKEKPKPEKSKEEILEEAEKYLKILNGDIPESARFHESVFEPTNGRTKSGYYHDGNWALFWDRMEGDYRYLNDYISIGTHEKYGLLDYNFNYFSSYSPPKQINISKEKAIEIAENNINKLMRSPLVGNWFDGYKTGQVLSSEMIIVNPNYVHIYRKDYNPLPQPYARLAWVVHFECINEKTNKKGILTPVQIWIDAETGEVLGGG